jgi:hypothetical protein
MGSTQIKTVIVAFLVIGCITTAFLLQHQAQARLQLDNESLRQRSEQMARLCASFRQICSHSVGEASNRLSETVSIDCGRDRGGLRHCGSGFLYGFSPNGSEPPDSAVAPLNIRLHRAGLEDTLAQAGRMKALGIQQQVVLSEVWGYEKTHPGDHGDWTTWEKCIRRQMDLVRQAGSQVQYDIWNEPDHGHFWGRTPEQFHETWTRACRTLRAADPAAIIVGPSWSNVHPGEPRFENFLLRCKTNDVLPDYITWHFPKDTVGEVRACREFCERAGIHVKGILINEYAPANEQTAAATAWHLAQLEAAQVDGACRAIWDDSQHNNLDGILAGGVPRGPWWVYRRYAEMGGQLLDSTPSANVDALAAADPTARKLDILLGRRGWAGLSVMVRVDHLEAVPFLGRAQGVWIRVEQIENQGGTVTNLAVLLDGTMGSPTGRAEFLIPWLNPGDAYAVQITPGRPERSTRPLAAN